MNPSQEKALLALALEKPADKRAAFMNAVCEGDPALRQRFETLLAGEVENEGAAALTADDFSGIGLEETSTELTPSKHRPSRYQALQHPGG